MATWNHGKSNGVDPFNVSGHDACGEQLLCPTRIQGLFCLLCGMRITIVWMFLWQMKRARTEKKKRLAVEKRHNDPPS